MSYTTLPEGLLYGKFDATGKALPFTGNTVIAHIRDTPISAKLRLLYEKLFDEKLNNKTYTLLPPESYHITLFDGACKRSDDGWYWPEGLPVDVPVKQCTHFMMDKIKQFNLSSVPFTFMVDSYKPLINTLAITLKPSVHSLYDIIFFRDTLSEVLGIRRPNHMDYTFHITLGYLLRSPEKNETNQLTNLLISFLYGLTDDEKLIVLKESELCEYETITKFNPVLYF